MKIGFIGQGWIGKHLADNFERRKYDIVRYAKEPEYAGNKEAIKDCEIVFIAVPTPSTPEGFDSSILEAVLGLVGCGKTAVIKSTIQPGTTDRLVKLFPDIYLLHAPEFLREKNVVEDVSHPERNVIGIPAAKMTDYAWHKAAEDVMAVLPPAPYEVFCTAVEAEITKYGGNNFLYVKVVYMNMLYDMAKKLGADWTVIKENLSADSRIGFTHMNPVDNSGHTSKMGRGAGGHCFIKDFAAFREQYEKEIPEDRETIDLLRAFERKNNKLLRDSGKDLDLLDGVYGPDTDV